MHLKIFNVSGVVLQEINIVNIKIFKDRHLIKLKIALVSNNKMNSNKTLKLCTCYSFNQ